MEEDDDGPDVEDAPASLTASANADAPAEE